MALLERLERPLSLRNRSFLRNLQAKERPTPRRPMTAAATPLNLRNKTEARKLRVLRQGWQLDAMNYTDAIPELSFAYRFLAHSSSRMRYFPALVNPDEPDGPPIPIGEITGVPSSISDSMAQALQELGLGRLAVSALQTSLAWQFGVPGECFIVGTQEQGDPQADWKIRSIEEFMIFDDIYKLREVPLDPQGILGWTDINPDTTYAARLWTPHYRFQKLATSPMRALLDVAEELLLLSRDVRATARSRLAGSGILKIPEGLRMESFAEDNEDPEAEDWFGRFAEAMMTPLSDEGTASAVVPIGLSGDPESLAQLDHLVIDRPYSAMAIELRAEAIGRLATGLDIPREVLEGISDPNHWGGWLVSDDTFRHHIEPQVIEQVDAMTVGFLRPYLAAAGLSQFWIDRACIWYDPVELISKPDPMANAVLLHDRFAISDASLREAGGFKEQDKPDGLEVEFRMLQKTRTFPPNMVEAIFHAFDPTLTFPPITQSGTIPGIGKSGEIAAEPPIAEPAAAAPDVGSTGSPPTTASPLSPQATPTPATAVPAPALAPPGPAMSAEVQATLAAARKKAVASARARAARKAQAAANANLSRKLTAIDGQLRARLQAAANAAMSRMLDKAGAKLRTRVADRKFRNDTARAVIAAVPNRHVAAALGPELVASLGFGDGHALLNPDWTDLHDQFVQWVTAAQTQSVKVAARLAKLDPGDPAIKAAARRMSNNIGPAWLAFEAALNTIAERSLYRPEPGQTADPTFDPNTLVPPGIIRGALSIAGGGTQRTLTAASGPDDDDEDDDDEDTDQPDTGDDGSGDDDDEGDDDDALGARGQASVLGDQTLSVEEPTAVGVDPPGGMVSVDVAGQIGGGAAIADMLAGADMRVASYEWNHNGVSPHPFEPHEDLDGTTFYSFTDDALTNGTGWPENDYYFPGDHEGCGCDFTTVWDDSPTGTGGIADDAADDTLDDPAPDLGSWDDDGNYIPSQAAPRELADALGYASRITGDPTDDDVAAAKKSLREVRQSIKDAARTVSDENNQLLRDAGYGAKDFGTNSGTMRYVFTSKDRMAFLNQEGSVDWFDALSNSEQERLRNGWMAARPTSLFEAEQQTGWDELVDGLAPYLGFGAEAGAEGASGGIVEDQVIQEWLDRTRIIDAARAVANGKLINPERYGGLDINTLLESPYDLTKLFANADTAAEEVATANAGEAYAEATSILGQPKLGAAAWEMTEAEYVEEAAALEEAVGALAPEFEDEWGVTYSQAGQALINRLAELIPEAVNDPSMSYSDMYRAILRIARDGGIV